MLATILDDASLPLFVAILLLLFGGNSKNKKNPE